MRFVTVLSANDENDEGPAREDVGASERRRSARRTLRLSVNTRSMSAGGIQVLIRDISPAGFLIEAGEHALAVDDWLEVGLPNDQSVKARVTWASGRFCGCTFGEPISAATISAALLMADPEPPHERAPAGDDEARLPRAERPPIQPELNLSAALLLALALWGLVAAAVYLVTH